MEDSEGQSVLVITGMHRSGTSLATSLLQSSGVFIGNRLMKEGRGNVKGHFEDWDFVDLHRDCLTSLAINQEGWTTQTNFSFSEEYLKWAKALIKKRSQHQVWGWKDPRTTLFLNSWSQLIASAKFIFIYRAPWDVVDSLFRRGDLVFKTDPKIAIETWFSYNQAILRFCQQTKRPWLLLRIEDVIQNPQFIIDSVNQQLNLNLRSPQALYDRSLFQPSEANLHRAMMIKQYFPHVLRLYLQLHQQATLSIQTPTEIKITENYQSPWFWQNWFDRPVVKVRSIRSWSKLMRAVTKK